MLELSDNIGEKLVKLARRAVEISFEKRSLELEKELCSKETDELMKEKMGVFVTLHTYPEHELRGCIGIPYPIKPLCRAVVNSTLSAAFEDPRFPPLRKDELDGVVFEVSVLTPPERIEYGSPQELLDKIVPFEDGLILEIGPFKGLFLPQVWEQIPDKGEFLANLCFKAGLWDKDCWKSKDARVYKFRVVAFEEEKPRGKIKRVSLHKSC